MAEPEMNIAPKKLKDEPEPKKSESEPEPKKLEDKSMPELLSDLGNDMVELINKEIALAKAELSEKIGSAAAAAALFSGSMFAVIMTLGTATALAIIALALVLPLWLAALIVTALWGVIAAILFLVGKQQATAAKPPVPEKTIETLKEDARWARKPIG